MESGDYTKAFSTLAAAQKIIDKNVKRNIVPKNRAARKKSQLTLKVNKLQMETQGAPAPAAAAPEPAAEAAA